MIALGHLIDLYLAVHTNDCECGGRLDLCRAVAQDEHRDEVLEAYELFREAVAR